MGTIALHIIAKEVSEADHLILKYSKFFDEIDIAVDGKVFGRDKVNIYKYEWDDAEKKRNYPSFDKKRNFLVSKCTCDYYFRLDTDDTIENVEGVKDIVAKLDANPQINAIACYYNYSRDNDGNCHAAHNRETVVRNNGRTRWNKPIHENIIPTDGEEQKIAIDKTIQIFHNMTPEHAEESKSRNLKFLLEEYEATKDNPDPRTLAYLGRMLYPMGYLQEARKFLEKHIKMSGWNEDRYMSWCMLADIYYDLGEVDTAKGCCYEALADIPDSPEAYLKLHDIYFKTKEWAKAIHWGKIGLATPKKETFMLQDPASYSWRPSASMAFCYLMIDDIDTAVQLYNYVKLHAPKQPWVKENQDIFETASTNKKYIDNFLWNLKYCEDKDKNVVPKLFDSIPKTMAGHELIVKLKHKYTKPRTWEDKEVAIYCGQAWETWAAPSVLKGIGGSEEAVIYNSKELVKLGYKVTVFCSCGEMAGEYEGVTYKQYYEFNPLDEYNIVIAWRGNIFGNIKAKKRIIWLHDVPVEGLLKKKDTNTYDTIIVLSEYHRSLLPNYIPEHKILVSANGINSKDFDVKKKPSRNLKRLIYTSSYDRGIQHLLEVWDDVLKEVPDAELHLFYGWNTYDAMMAQGNRPKEFRDFMTKLMAKPSVFEHGRVNHKTLIKEFYKSGVYVYPSHFQEISCISAMKAQACGCVPLVFNYAALRETVKAGVKIEGIGSKPEDMVKFKDELVKLLNDSVYQEKLRREVDTHKDEFGWDEVAKQWDKELFPAKRNDYKSLEEYKKEYTTHGEFQLSNFQDGTIMYHRRYQFVMEQIKELNIKSILDVGCSDGALVFAINEIGNIKADGIDADAKAVKFANAYAYKSKYNSEFTQSIVEEFEPTMKYQAISCLEMIEHVIDPKGVLDKMESMIEDGGYIFISTPDKHGYFGEDNFNPQHINHYNKEDLEKLIGKERIVAWDKVSPDLLTVVYKV